MLVTRVSPLTNVASTRDLDVTQQQLDDYAAGKGLVQRIFPNLSDSDREFIMTGYTDEDWENMFGSDEDGFEEYLDSDAK